MTDSTRKWWHVINGRARLRLYDGKRPADTVADRIAAAAGSGAVPPRSLYEIIDDHQQGHALADAEGYTTGYHPGITAWVCSSNIPPDENFGSVKYDPTTTF